MSKTVSETDIQHPPSSSAILSSVISGLGWPTEPKRGDDNKVHVFSAATIFRKIRVAMYALNTKTYTPLFISYDSLVLESRQSR